MKRDAPPKAQKAPTTPVSPKPSILLTWLPLAAMWVLMAVEQPAIAAVMARMSEATLQLAAFGITYSLALFIEGPVIQMLAAGTAVADNRENYRRLMGMMRVLGWGATVVHGVLCIPGVFRPFLLGVIGAPPRLVEPARLALTAMLPWTLAVGFRRLWQGVLIRYGRTGVVPITMAIRMAVSFAVLAIGFATEALPGAVLGGAALSAGVVVGAAATWIFVRPVVRGLRQTDDDGADPGGSVMTWPAMIRFYIPLALTNFIILGARPVVQMGLARGLLPLESLALWPVSMGYIFLYTAFSLSSQEVVIARLEDAGSRTKLLRFSVGLGAVLAVLHLVVLATPLWRLWFSGVSGLSDDLTALAPPVLALVFPVMPLSALISLYRGALVRSRRTGDVSIGVAVNAAVLLTSLFVGVAVFSVPAIVVSSAAYALAFGAETVYLASRRPLAAFRG